MGVEAKVWEKTYSTGDLSVIPNQRSDNYKFEGGSGPPRCEKVARLGGPPSEPYEFRSPTEMQLENPSKTNLALYRQIATEIFKRKASNAVRRPTPARAERKKAAVADPPACDSPKQAA